MRPILFDGELLGLPLTLPAYRTLSLLAMLAAVCVGCVALRRADVPLRKALPLLAGVLTATAVGARLYYAAAVPGHRMMSLADALQPRFVNLALYGGLLAGVCAAGAVGRALRVRHWLAADALAPAGALGVAVWRLGCFLNGCCGGIETGLPWGVRFPPGSLAYQQHALTARILRLLGAAPTATTPSAVHPTQLYEAVAALLAVLIVVALRRRGWGEGAPALAAALWFTAFRLGNHHLRQFAAGSGSPPPWAYVLLLALLGLALWRRLAATNETRRELAGEPAGEPRREPVVLDPPAS